MSFITRSLLISALALTLAACNKPAETGTATGAAPAASASASAHKEMPELAKKNGCTACHAIDKKMVGPAWAEVAKKHKGQADAVTRISAKIMKGGSGEWGPTPMPPSANLTEAQANELATFVMSLVE